MRRSILLLVAVLALLAGPWPFSDTLALGPRAALAQVDIQVQSLTLTPPTNIVVGQPVTLTATIRNGGTVTLINNFYVEFLQSVGGTRTRIVEKLVTTDLGAGQSTQVTHTWTATAVDSIVFNGDNRKFVPETNENNNVMAVPVTIARPDFAITDIRPSPPEQMIARGQDMIATVTNLGVTIPDSVRVALRVDGTLIGTTKIPSVAQGATANVTFPGWVADAGAHFVRAVVDSPNVWTESNEGNNVFLDTVTVALPDLAVRDIFWVPAAPAVGDTVTVYAEIENRASGGNANAFSVRFDVDGVWTAQTYNEDIGLAERSSAFSNASFESGTLGSWATTTGWTSTAHPGATDSTGNKYYARAAAGGATLESNPFVISATSITFRGRALVGAFPGTFEVRTTGGAVLGSRSFGLGPSDSWLAYVVDLTGHVGENAVVRVTTAGGGAMVDDIRMAPAPGTPLLVGFRSGVWVSTAGNHSFKFTVDDGSNIAETNEANNTRTEILLRGPGDYVLTGLRVEPVIPIAGRACALVATVENLGIAQGSMSDVCFTVDGQAVGCASMPGLAQGASMDVRLNGWMPTPGSHNLSAAADANNAIPETDEGNNGFAASASVPLPDLVVQDIRWIPAFPADGDSVTVYAEIGNLSPGGSVAEYSVTLSSTAGDSTVVVFDDAAVGRRKNAFPNADFETGNFVGWNPGPYWTIIPTLGDPAATQDRWVAHTDSSAFALVSQPFVVTDSTLTFRGATAFNYRPATFEVLHTDSTVIRSLTYAGTSVPGWDWQAHSVDLSSCLGDTVIIRVIPNSGGARIDDVRLGSDGAAPQVVSFPCWRWAASSAASELTVTVDALGVIPETQEGNNTLMETLVPGLADFVVTGLRLSPDRQAAGNVQGLLAKVKNLGAPTSRVSQLCFEVDGNPVGCVDTPGLDTDEEQEILFSGWVGVPGNHALTVFADHDNEIGEGSEFNNFLGTVIQVPVPDLHVRHIYWTPAVPDSGDTVTIFAEIENLGRGGNAANYQVQFRVDSTNEPLTVRDDVGVGEQADAFPNAGFESGDWTGWTGHTGWTLGNNPTDPATGTDRFYAGCSTGSLTLTSAPFVVTDTTLSFRGASAFQIWPGTLTVYRTGGQVVNSIPFGSATSGSWDWQCRALDVSAALGDSVYVRFLSSNGGARVDDLRMGEDPLAVTLVSVVSRTWVATVGSHSVTCMVDVGLAIPEESDKNNSLTVPLINAFSLCPPSQVPASPGDTVEVPLQVYGAEIPGLQNLGFDIEYDEANLDYLGFVPDPALAGWTINVQTVGTGILRFSFAGPSPVFLQAGDDMVRLRFATAPFAFGNSGVALENPTGDLAVALSCGGQVSFTGDVSGLPDGAGFTAALGAAFPNPFRNSSSLQFTVPEGNGARVVLSIYNIQGQLVRTLLDGDVPAGAHQVDWSADSDRGDRVAPGIYFAVMQQGAVRAVRKMVLVH